MMSQSLILPPSQKVSVKDYVSLRSQVRAAIHAGKLRAADAVEAEKVRTAWEVGKLIHEHILLNAKRAAYGAQVIKRLSNDLLISKRELHYMVEFARTYPIVPTSAQLSWGHYRDLLAVNEAEKREELVRRAAKGKWSLEKTRNEIKKLKAAKEITTAEIPAEALLEPKKGKLDTYQIVVAKLGPYKGKPVIDLGFSNYHRPQGKFSFQEGDIVQATRGSISVVGEDHSSLFTYRVYFGEATDADTLWVLVDLGFGFTTKQHLRLRGIDAPEIATRDGEAAKRLVERWLRFASQIVITSTKSDKYDRYLADVFYIVKGKEKFLNNELLKRGFATRVD